MIRFALKGLLRRKLRTALTALAIVLGVAMISGTYVLTDSIDSAFDTIFTEVREGSSAVITGKAAFDLSEGSGATAPAFPESVLETVRGVDGVALASTVPLLVRSYEELADRYAHAPLLVVGPGTKTGIPVLFDDPRQVGPDRIVNAVSARERYGAPCIVVDFGTSTNFDAVSSAGEYVGGVIAPGIEISMDALFARAARLVKVELVAPEHAIGKTTVAGLQSGLFFGFAGQVDGIVERMQEELGGGAKVIATGGLAELIAPHSKTIEQVDPLLTLDGLRLLWSRRDA